jgi:hypothetical protein
VREIAAEWRWLQRVTPVAALLWLVGSGCAQAPKDGKARLEELNRQGLEMSVALDVVEERLLGAQANLQLWQEIAQRHQNVSAIACENLSNHASGMVRNQERQAEKSRSLRRPLASATRATRGIGGSGSAGLQN